MTDATAAEGSAPSRAALSRELSEFLIELSIGVHRYAMYPPGHPSLGPAVQGIVRKLGPLLTGKGQLNIGVARRQLVIEGLATEQKHPVLSELARRLHDLQLGAVRFSVGVDGEQVIGLLATLAKETDDETVPVGLLPEDEIPTWPNIQLFTLGYERLSITDDEDGGAGEDRATELWLGLARAALAGEDLPPEVENDPGAIAECIREHGKESAYDQVIVGYMLQLASELKTERGADSERVRQRMAELVREMDTGTLDRLVEMGGDFSARRRFVLDANQSLAMDSVMKVLDSAASASGQTVSTSMTRLLSKLAVHADQGAGRLKTQASQALQDNVERLLDDWELEDPNPDEYTRVLDAISKAAPIFGTDEQAAELEEEEEEIPGPLRLLQTALEIDAYGPTIEAAVLDLINMGYAGTVLTLAKEAPPESEIARDILRQMTNPGQVRRYLSGDDVDDDALEGLVESMGEAAIPPFLDALAESESRSVRRKVFDRVVQMGPTVAEQVLVRLEGEGRWYVLRNWLALLQPYPEQSDQMNPLTYLQHADARVRREALPIALERAEVGERALAMALADPDDRNCRLGLSKLPSPVPGTLLPTLLKRVIQGDRDSGLRASAIRAVRETHVPLVRDALIEVTSTGKSLLGKVKLAEESPHMLAALMVLSTEWPGDKAAHPILEQAEKSKSAAIRAAIRES